MSLCNLLTLHTSPVSIIRIQVYNSLSLCFSFSFSFSVFTCPVTGVEVSGWPGPPHCQSAVEQLRADLTDLTQPTGSPAWPGLATAWVRRPGRALQTELLIINQFWKLGPTGPRLPAGRQKLRKTEILLEIMYYILKLVTAPTPALPGKNTQIVL